MEHGFPTRLLAAYNQVNKKTCETYVAEAAPGDAALAATVCNATDGRDWTKLEQLRPFALATANEDYR